MDGPLPTSPTDVLFALGVRGPVLAALAGAEPRGLSPPAIRDEWLSLGNDRRVRNRPAVLVQRLATRFGVDLPARNGQALRPLERDVLANIAQMRAARNGHHRAVRTPPAAEA